MTYPNARAAFRTVGVALFALVVLAPTTATEMPLAPAVPSLSSVVARATLAPRRAAAGSGASRAPTKPTLAVFLDGDRISFRIQAFPVLPGAGIRLEAPRANAAVLEHQAGDVSTLGEASWRWTAPAEPGIYALQIHSGPDTVDLTALVLHPASSVRGGVLNGYSIGAYPARPLRGDPAYVPPVGFVEVGADEGDVLVTPRFTLGQFKCKQPGEPAYLAFSPALLFKLEAIADALEVRGMDPTSLRVMSGFRTPKYNAAIGNETGYSRHLWGDAADIYVDQDGDGAMDDLNQNGRLDLADAGVLLGWIDRLAALPEVRPGGLATYGPNAAHGPFVHVDARGTPARW